MRIAKTLLLFAVLVFVASALTACETVGPIFGQYKNQLESIVGVAVAGQYTVSVTKDGKTLVTQTWTCTTDGTKLTGCHQTGVPTSTPGVAVPK